MLRRIKPDTRVEETDAAVKIADASFPVPFGHRLEFNAPVHGTWNIVHIGMLVPQCHQIYVCADNCMRGVVLTAAEMGADDRFSSVLLEEDDLYDQNLETIFTSVAATFNNIGPGLSTVGPTANFAHFSLVSKYVLI